MAFVRVDKSARGGHIREAAPTVRMGAHLQSDKESRGIYIGISFAIIDQVGWEVTQTGKRRRAIIEINEGTLEDAGFWLLTQSEDEKGYAIGSEANKGYAFAGGVGLSRLQHYVLNECPVPVQDVEYTVDEKEHTILIQCPDWLRYNPQSVPEEVKKEAPLRLNREERRRVASHVARALRK